MKLPALISSAAKLIQLPLDRRSRARRLRAAVTDLQTRLCRDPAEIAEVQSRLLREIVVHAVDTCPFWRNRFVEAGIPADQVQSIADLAKLPVLEKKEVVKNLASMSSSAFGPSQRMLASTGGSTAAPMQFYRNAACVWQREINNGLLLRWLGRDPEDPWALVWGAMCDLGMAGSRRQAWYDYLRQRCVVLPGNQLTARNMDAFLVRMRRARVKFVHGYSQSIWLFARHLLDTNAKVPRVECVTLTAEAISDEQKRDVERAFRCPAYCIYGAREFGYIAAEYPHHQGLHMNPWNCIVEFLNSDGQPAAMDEPGQMVITDLTNFATPLIRYRIGDIGYRMDDSAPGSLGLPRMQLTAGRESDFVVTPDGRYISGVTIAQLKAPGCQQLQFVQRERRAVTVRYVPNHEFNESSLPLLREALHTTFGEDLGFGFEETDAIRPLPSGKTPYVVSEVARRELRRRTDPHSAAGCVCLDSPRNR